MNVKCIENKSNNGNFTLGKIYKITSNRITCDFVKLELPNNFIFEDNFEFAFCKFEIIK